MARTIDIGFRRDPQPPMPMVMPSSSSATTSSSLMRLSAIAPILTSSQLADGRPGENPLVNGANRRRLSTLDDGHRAGIRGHKGLRRRPSRGVDTLVRRNEER